MYLDVLPDKRAEGPKLTKAAIEAINAFESAEFVGLFFPRGSGFMYALMTKYKDYATWEKVWSSPAFDKIREVALPIITRQMDMFFDLTSQLE